MRKINSLLKETPDSQFNNLAKQAEVHQNLRQLWGAVAPTTLTQHSFAGNLKNGQLTIFAYNASVATKIKLTSASLLTQLQNFQKTDPFYKEFKVTAIVVKVQVKSQQKTSIKTPRKLSNQASASLKNLAEQLGDSVLSDKLKQLASKQ